jgi:hypothetical protein
VVVDGGALISPHIENPYNTLVFKLLSVRDLHNLIALVTAGPQVSFVYKFQVN